MLSKLQHLVAPSILLSLFAVSKTTSAQTSDWDEAYSKALDSLAKLSQNEKIGIVTGTSWQNGSCVGNTYQPSSIDYPSLCLQDGPLGIRYANPVTAFPAGINAGATWDRSLIKDRGAALGEEAKSLGVHVSLGPVAGPLGKVPQGGRLWEGFSVDPYLSGVAMTETINGVQGAGAQACAKHYIGNEQETNRNYIDSTIDDRAFHELYLWPFADAVRANVASVMCSYNKVNGTYTCENPAVLNHTLKTELGFKGYIMSDWGAQHTTSGSANAGLDMTMPGSDLSNPPGNVLWGQKLADAISNGEVEQSRLDDMVTRILAAWYLVGQDQGYPSVQFNSWNGGQTSANVTGDHATVVRNVARDSIVLLKNDNNTLPLSKPNSLAIIGSDAAVNPDGPNACSDRGCDTGTLAMGWGSGTCEFPYLVGPLEAIKNQANADGTTITSSTTDSTSDGASAAQNADVAIVFINSDSGEGYINVEGSSGDRLNLDPWHSGNELVQAVAQVNQKTIVVIHSVGPLVLESILAEPNVVAIVWAGLPGQESGNALVDILYGSTAPSGKLPYTIAKQESDYGTSVVNGDDNFSEGIFVDYRHFDHADIEPRYEFGYGLSYTTFNYSGLAVDVTVSAGATSGETVSGGPSDLFTEVGTVSASVQNTGQVTGAEVAQLYIGLPSSAPSAPPKQLRGFQKILLEADESDTASFSLTRRDLSYWDTQEQKWVVPSGEFSVYVGSSSRDIRLTDTFTV
uniref:Probable beta-glucosidase L n=1 Tax=Talaromyces piceae TaxID=153982 RepID=A0A2D2AGW9_9EURO|nr:beta-glucosidase [Talaromyces piceae]